MELFGFMITLPILTFAVIGFIIAVILAEKEVFQFLLMLAIVVGIGISYFNGFAPFTWIYNHVFEILIYTLGYLIIGILWSFFKFDRLAAKKAQELELRNLDMESVKKFYIVKSSNYLNIISNWIIAWPFSIVAYLLSDLVVELVNQFKKVYDSIAYRHFKKYIENSPTEKGKV